MASAVEENRKAGLLASQKTDEDKKRHQAKAQTRMAVNPPIFAEYALVGLVALANDLTDYLFGIFEITGVVWVILKIADLATVAILLWWAYTRGVEKHQGNKSARRIWRMVFGWLIEMIPFLGALSPTWVITVYLAHKKHRKLYNEAEAARREATVEEAYDGGAGLDYAEEAA